LGKLAEVAFDKEEERRRGDHNWAVQLLVVKLGMAVR